MHFDDRLATVLRQSATGSAVSRIQYRQLIDLLGTVPNSERSEFIDAAYLRLAELSERIAPDHRAAILREASARLRSPRLVAQLASDSPPVASAAIARAELRQVEWLDLIPALPVTARAFLRDRRGLGERVEALLERLGIHDRGLPPAQVEKEDLILDAVLEEEEEAAARPTATVVAFEARVRAEPKVVADSTRGDLSAETGDAIRAIVRRIEEFRKSRDHGHGADGATDPELPLDAPHNRPLRRICVVDFATDPNGRITWADGPAAPMVVGIALFSESLGSVAIAQALRGRQPIRGRDVVLSGAPAIAGLWQVDAGPLFDRESGRFIGYHGRMRRLDAEAETDVASGGEDGHAASGDRMRAILHELKTPVNAIQGFAELIQQSFIKPVPHGYRALAAAIAGEAARILAVLEEFDRLVRLENGQLAVAAGQCDLAALIRSTVARLEAHTAARNSGFDLEIEAEAEPALVGIDPEEAEMLVWRLLAALAGEAVPGERLRLRLRRRDGQLGLSIRLPERLSKLDDQDLFAIPLDPYGAAVTAGMLGPGFALRLAFAEVRSAGGVLQSKRNGLRLLLPDLTVAGADHSHGQEAKTGR